MSGLPFREAYEGTAHFLFRNGAKAREVLEAAGVDVLEVRDVIVQRLKHDVPGQLGILIRRMADAGVNIEVLYSDHGNQLILVVADLERARQVSDTWTKEVYEGRSRIRGHRRYLLKQVGY